MMISSSVCGSSALLRKAPAFLILALTLACDLLTDPADSGPPPTVLVINGTCDAGECAPLEIRAFPSNQPNTPGGLWSIGLGTVVGEMACLTLHRADTFRVIASGVGVCPDTTYFVWRPGEALSLGTLAPGASGFSANPETEPFSPGSGSGWSVTLPGDATVSSAPTCG